MSIFFSRLSAAWRSCTALSLLMLVSTAAWAADGSALAVQALWPLSAVSLSDQAHVVSVMFQSGLAFALLAWVLIQSPYAPRRVYAVMGATLLCLLVTLLLQNAVSAQDGKPLESSLQYVLLCAVMAYKINLNYLLHLVLADSSLQQRRHRLFVCAYVVALLSGVTLSMTDMPWLADVFHVLNSGLLLLICSDFWRQLRKTIGLTHRQRWQLAVMYLGLMGLVIDVFSALAPETAVISTFNLADLANLLWIPMAFALMKLLTVQHQQTFKQRCNDASQARHQADSENTLRLNQQRFLSMLMHEIRTPLSVIKIGSDALIQASPSGKVTNTWSKRMEIAIDNITQVIENCVQAEKHDAGLIQPRLSRFMAEEEVADMNHQILAANPEFTHRIHVVMDEQASHWLRTDKHYLRSILMNLISNALKYSPPLSPVYLRLTEIYGENQTGLKFEIESTLGKAGAPDPAQLFQRYYRAEAAKKYAGTGLGLWLSQTLASQLGTRIHMVLSERQTVIFYFNLPLLHHA